VGRLFLELSVVNRCCEQLESPENSAFTTTFDWLYLPPEFC